MTTWMLRALNATEPTGFLAALGLCTALPASQLRFTNEHCPALTAPTNEDEAVAQVVASLTARTHPDCRPLGHEKNLWTTTPAWEALDPACNASWTEPDVDALLRTYQIGSTKQPRQTPWQVTSASLMLISGRSYLGKALEQAWPDGYDQATSLRTLLRGDFPSMARGMSLRLTATESSPRLRGGDEQTWICPIVELLGLLGMTALLPRQLSIDPAKESPPSRGITWTLNPVPMSAHALIDLHEQQTPPAGWPRFTASVKNISVDDRQSHFTNIHRLEDY